MGNSNQPVQQKEFIQHERIGATRIFYVTQKNEDEQMQQFPKMQITRSIQSKKTYDDWVLQLRKINDAQGQQLFLVPQSHNFQKAGLCGNSGLITMNFQKFEFVLSSQIKNRKILKKYFEQTQIWYVLYNLVRAGNKFQILKQKIGDIHPRNILINQDGQTAIISKFSLPDEIQNFDRYIQNQKIQVFLAPQQIKSQDIQKKVYNNKTDKCLAQVFSLGMTLLSAGTLQPCNQVYQHNPFRINQQRLRQLINEFSKRYRPYLTNTLKSMLQMDPSRRVRSRNLFAILSQFQHKILDLEPFQVPQPVQVQGHHGHSPQNVSFIPQNNFNNQQYRPVVNVNNPPPVYTQQGYPQGYPQHVPQQRNSQQQYKPIYNNNEQYNPVYNNYHKF